jgi:uncharacterized protein YbaP (TraB family)
MKRFLYPVLTALVLSLCLSATAQKKIYPNTLLWRISGNGLTKPSYLFGTMHLNDRRLFHFSDSLYNYLEKAEAFAMEVDADEMMKALILSFSADDTSGYLKDAMNKEDYKNIAGELEAQFGIPASKVTKKQVWIYKQSIQSKTKSKADDMDSFVDAYLFNIAKRQGKWVGGIEDVEDQLNLFQDFEDGFSLNNKLFQKKENQLKEKLIKTYIAQDLNAIQDWFDEMEPKQRFKMLTKRNLKMAERIDSMSAAKSCFFAVGAAHLPGNDGLIDLLVSKGFTVDPVTSKNKIAPEKYTYKAVDLPWIKVENEVKAYTAFMPGEAVPYQPEESSMKMHIYGDIGTGLSYIVMHIRLPSAENKEELVKRISNNFLPKDKSAQTKIINHNGYDGVEVYRFEKGYHFRMQVIQVGTNLVLAMVGSKKKSQLNEKEAEKFYQMLQVHEVEPVLHEESFVFSDPQKSFEINFPGKPSLNKQIHNNISEQEDAENWNFSNEGYTNATGDIYYSIIYKETKPGFFLQSDFSIFEASRQYYKTKENFKITRLDSLTWQGSPSLWLDGVIESNKLNFRTVHINKGNRSYSLISVFADNADTGSVNSFINSFKLSDNHTQGWKMYSNTGNTFTTKAPAPLEIIVQEENTDNSVRYLSYDDFNGFSFQVYAEPLPPYYWSESDSSLYAELLNSFKTLDDTLVFSKTIRNGKAEGMEYRLMIGEERRNMKRVQMFIHNDSTYTLIFVAPEQYASSTIFDPFFTEFRFVDFVKTTKHLEDKTNIILNDLLSKDSTVFDAAKTALEDESFNSKHLPALHKALLEPHADFNENTFCTHDIIINKIASINDATTISFIEKNYASLSGEKEKLKFPLLRLLANIKTEQSYKLLQNFLVNETPNSGRSFGLAPALSDSLSLAASIFPGILKVAGNKEIADVIAIVSNALIDSNYIKISELESYKHVLMQHAKNIFETSGVQYDWILYNWVLLLGKFNDAESNALLTQVLKSGDLELVYDATIVLLKNKQQIDNKVILRLAEENTYRLPLYLELEKLNALKLFPSKYLNQKSIAESQLHGIAIDYGNVENINYIGERVGVLNGTKQKFLLFKVQFNDDEGLEEYLGIAGPYPINSKKIGAESKATGFATGFFNAKTIDTQFKQYLLSLEED